MKIGIAQTKSVKGDINENIAQHKKWITLAIDHQVNSIFFPELSLTGYEPTLAKALAANVADKAFDDFQEISTANNITIAVGMPTNTTAGIHISMLIFQPNGVRQTYSKQQLHADELPYFIAGHKQLILTVAHCKIAPAICFESLQTNHASQAAKLGAAYYVASVAKS